jgi:hypothetical protein
MPAPFTRRSALAAALALAAYRSAPAAADPFPAAIRRAQMADAVYREAGRFAREIQAAGLALPAGWRAYRIGLQQARTAARSELHALTPETPEAATALVTYYRQRAEASGDPAAFRAARSRLRKIAQRPGVAPLDITALARASPG